MLVLERALRGIRFPRKPTPVLPTPTNSIISTSPLSDPRYKIRGIPLARSPVSV
jgi:hypothetical protein